MGELELPGKIELPASAATVTPRPDWFFPEDVPGWLEEEEGRALAALAAGKVVLEVGSYHGRSAICMAQVAARLHSVDHHRGDPESGSGGTLGAFRLNLERFGLTGKVRLHVAPFAEVAPKLPAGTFDLVFIDGAHDRANVAHDAEAALRLARPGGIVAFHDWDRKEVRMAAAEASPLFTGRPAGQVVRTAWFQVPSPGTFAVEICVPTREGQFDDDVIGRIHAACGTAARAGISCEMVRATDHYGVAVCRNRGVAGFLFRQADYLLFVDDDVKIPQRTIVILLDLARQNPKAVVCGCVPSFRIDADGEIAAYVQVYRPDETWYRGWPRGVVEANLCGGGCMLIPRQLLLDMGHPWFRWVENYKPGGGVKAVSDDADFCTRARALGYRILATGDVRCGHKKVVDVAQLIDPDLTD